MPRSAYLSANTKWTQNAVTAAEGNGQGSALDQLDYPCSIIVDVDYTIYIVDTSSSHRILAWRQGEIIGQVVEGGNGPGSCADRLNDPRDVIIDHRTDSLIISDCRNRRVVRWPRHSATRGETIVSDVGCYGLAMDVNGALYVTDGNRHEVKRYRPGESHGTVVAGGNGEGSRLDQLSYPTYVFVDRDSSVYVSDQGNHRVMKWMKNAKEGIVVAGGQGHGNHLTQLSSPHGIVVDELGSVYVADYSNHRIMPWGIDAREGAVVVGGNGRGDQANQFFNPSSLSFDVKGNLYVLDRDNHRVQRFTRNRN